MKKNYPEMAKNILHLVGGAQNVEFVMNCATRLRFTLKDIEKAEANREEIKNMKGVIDVIVQNGQFQVCIGPDVIDVCKEVKKLGNFEAAKEAPAKQEKLMDRFFSIISGVFTPIVPVLMAAGMVGALLTVLDLTGILPSNSPTYYVWNLIKEAGFYFLPFYIAYTASQKLNANPFLSMLIAGVLLHPQLSDFSSLGVEQLSFFGLGIRSVSYSSTVLPIIFGVWMLSYCEKFFTKICPQIIRAFSVPMLSTMVVVPVMLLIIGPATSLLADYMSAFVQFLGINLGFLAVGIIAALTPIMIATGTHSFAFPVIVTTLAMNGYEALIVPAMLAENLAMAGAAFGAGLLCKDKDEKAEANAACLSACLGISEPAMYGICLPRKTPFYASIIGSGIGGVAAGLLGVRFYTIASASFVGLPATIGEGSAMGAVYALVVIALSFASAMITALLLGKKGEPAANLEKTESSDNKIAAPVSGKVVALCNVNDQTFASGAMGQGIAIDPVDGVVCAPADGTLEMLFDTHHALGLKTNSGAEILIHVGMDTVNLNGKYFTPLKKVGDRVRKGEALLKFDLEQIKKAGYETITPVIVTNSSSYSNVLFTDAQSVQSQDFLLELA